MASYETRKPENKAEFMEILKRTAKKEIVMREIAKHIPKGFGPTVSGTAKLLNIHRDTLYSWLKEFEVDFKVMTNTVNFEYLKEKETTKAPTYLIGEALVGEGNEVAHLDVLVGDKNGPVGKAFAAGLSNLSVGHTPVLAVIRPNLPPKPHTLLVPKVTIKNLDDATKIFGPVQAAVAKAVADSVEEGVIPKDKIDTWVIICSIFIHPEAKDYRRLYHYNYGATKMAIKRALSNYPPLDKIMYDKDRATHPIMGFSVPRLWRPPYLQVSLDVPDVNRVKKIISQLPKSDRLILEVGTPLLKRYGTKVISELREITKDVFVVADLKTLDVGKVEVDLAFDETADAVVAAGLAPVQTLNAFIYEAERLGIYSAVDMLNVDSPIEKLKVLDKPPKIVILHRGIDEETGRTLGLKQIKEIKEEFKANRILIGVAGGIVPETAKEALRKGADILIVGRYITQSKDVERSVRDFLELTEEMRKDVDQFRVHVE